MADPLNDQDQTPEEGSREYMSRVVDVMQSAQEIISLERTSLLAGLAEVTQQAQSVSNEAEAMEAQQTFEFLLTMTANYTLALRVTETIGASALQILAQTGIVVPPPSPILSQDGEVLSTSGRKPRKPRKEA